MTNKLVPVEPTEEMLEAFCASMDRGFSRQEFQAAYKATLAAAPTAQAEPGSKPLRPNCYWKPDDTESPYDCCDDLDIINDLFYEGAKVGDEYELNEAHYFPAKFRIVKIPDDTNDDYEVERISGKDLYTHAPDSAAALAAKDAEISRLTNLLKLSENHVEWRHLKAIAQQAERIISLESSLSLAVNSGIETIEEKDKQLAAANALIASKDALIEQARDALALNEVFMETPVAERKVQPFTQTHDALAAIERHLKGEES